MIAIQPSKKPLAVNPIKAGQPLGAALAFLGLAKSLPLLHGSQGCTAFGKVFFVRHFREPIPFQTTAMDQVSTIMGADDNIREALATICAKNGPGMIGLISTGLSETQGCDLQGALREFRAAHPEHAAVDIVAVNAPDTQGCLESGFALAVEALIASLAPASRHAGRRHKQVNVLAGSLLTPGDIEALKEWIEAFGLRPVVLPDLGDALDGHLIAAEHTPLTLGGTPANEIRHLGEAAATLVIGASLHGAADLLKIRTGVPDFRFAGLMGLEDCDALTATLSEISGRPVPERLERQRSQLQDAMVDGHFMFGFRRVAMAADPDLLAMHARFLHGMGAELVAAVAPTSAAVLAGLPCEQVTIGDLADLERAAQSASAELLIGSAHLVATAERLGVPLLRAGYPQYDRMGGHARVWVGYRGTRQALFDIANLVLGEHHELAPYRSLYRAECADPSGPLSATRARH